MSLMLDGCVYRAKDSSTSVKGSEKCVTRRQTCTRTHFMHFHAQNANANPKTLLAKNPLRALEMCVNKSVFDSEVGQ